MDELAPVQAAERLRELKQRITAVDTSIGRESWHSGAAPREIAERERWRHDGVESWKAWVRADHIDPATARCSCRTSRRRSQRGSEPGSSPRPSPGSS